MKFLALIVLILFPFGVLAQEGVYPTLPQKGSSLRSLVPKGWSILEQSAGDLNKDGLEDAALVIQTTDSLYLENSDGDSIWTKPRILLVCFLEPDGSYVLREQSHTLVPKDDQPYLEDPFQSLQIRNGILIVKLVYFYSAGDWHIYNIDYKFRFQQGELKLIGADMGSLHRATLDYKNYSYNFMTRRRELTTGSEQKAGKKTSWKDLPPAPLKTLKTLTAPFSWEVEPDVFL